MRNSSRTNFLVQAQPKLGLQTDILMSLSFKLGVYCRSSEELLPEYLAPRARLCFGLRKRFLGRRPTSHTTREELDFVDGECLIEFIKGVGEFFGSCEVNEVANHMR